MEKEITENNFNRLAISIMSKENCSYDEAMAKLSCLKLNLICGEEIKNSLPLQAALLTAVNTSKRAFLGGINIVLPENISCLVPWPNQKTINDIVVKLGGKIISSIDEKHFTLTFGLPANIDNKSLQIICNDWVGGILNGDEKINLESSNNLPLGGIAAGALGVGQAFLRTAGIHISAGDSSIGISLWRPDLDWLDKDAQGVKVKYLPKKYWLLGLGHLGQAFLWNIGLLPYENPAEVTLLLQDYDHIAEANLSAGLLSELKNEGEYKTRLCSRWMEDRGYKTIITERKFDVSTKCNADEPLVALCGFDSATSRVHLEKAGFDLIVEAALGGNLSLFDNIILHTFPNADKSPGNIWGNKNDKEDINSIVLEKFSHLTENGCGVIAQTLASKAISSSFVGAFTGALVIAELLRGLNSGNRYNTIVTSIRDLKHKQAIIHDKKKYSTEMSRNGFLLV